MADSPLTENAAVSRFVFLLLPNYSMTGFASAVEPLRIANRMSEQSLYEWKIISETGENVRCSNGAELVVDSGFYELDRDQTIIVCGGIDIKSATTKPVMGWLRRESRKGMAIGALCTATYVLAKAGLLDGRRSTIHWENRESFLEEFPDLELSTAIFTVDRNRYTSAGGAASLDLMLKLIGAEHGAKLANAVADQMIHTAIRTDKDDQRLSIPTRIGVRHPKLAKVIHMMEENLEEPISPSDLAADVGMSTRQLERLFRRYLDRSPKRYYMELRLRKSRNLLLQTEMSVINVALACGFSSPSHFSKCYRSHFQTTPYRERGAQEH
ncbi:MAG: GlxA family transcriptional regulator [Rhodobacteraceae bacterium]|nr:GlxA family transcriptional regulator [Paracoccaceae bacterium]